MDLVNLHMRIKIIMKENEKIIKPKGNNQTPSYRLLNNIIKY